MKVVLKILTALAAIAGVVYVMATYGDKIVAWCKRVLPCGCDCDCEDCDCECGSEECECECNCECASECEEEAACECACETPAEETANEVSADESDFAN